MFEQSLVESTNILRSNNRWPAIASFAAQCALVAAIVAIPILHPEVLPIHAPKLLFLAPPPRPPQPPPPTQPVHLTSTTTSTFSAPAATAAPSTAVPRIIPSTILDGPGDPAPAFTTLSTMGNPGGNPLSAVLGPGTSTRIVATPIHTGPLHISKGVSAGLLLTPIQPIYPPIARAAHVGGIVIVQAVISKSGQITSAHVISGPAMLSGAALDAVRNARYRPFLLNGDPTEVDTTFSINFILGS